MKLKQKLYYFFKYHFFYKTRLFIRQIIRKYVLCYDFWTKEKLSNRQERQNRHFRWSKENIEKINCLNKHLTKLIVTEQYNSFNDSYVVNLRFCDKKRYYKEKR